MSTENPRKPTKYQLDWYKTLSRHRTAMPEDAIRLMRFIVTHEWTQARFRKAAKWLLA
jgi:hypothetical protein